MAVVQQVTRQTYNKTQQKASAEVLKIAFCGQTFFCTLIFKYFGLINPQNHVNKS